MGLVVFLVFPPQNQTEQKIHTCFFFGGLRFLANELTIVNNFSLLCLVARQRGFATLCRLDEGVRQHLRASQPVLGCGLCLGAALMEEIGSEVVGLFLESLEALEWCSKKMFHHGFTMDYMLTLLRVVAL